MRNLLQIFVSLCLLIIISSCSSEEEIVLVEQVNDFTMLEVGNYWIYEWYEIEPNGVTTILDRSDTVYISGVINTGDKELFLREATFLGSARQSYLFDSANMIFTFPEREIYLTLDNSIEQRKILGFADDPIATVIYSLEEGSDYVEVPAGRFECINFKGVIQPLREDYPHGERYNFNHYSEKVGLVSMRTQFYNSPNDIEMRLVSYGKSESKPQEDIP